MLNLKKTLIPFVIVIYIVSNIIMTLLDITICESNGCTLSKEIINISYLELNFIGLAYAIILLVLSILNHKYLKQFALLGILTETILISMLYLLTSELCLFCLGFYSLLILNYIVNQKEYKLDEMIIYVIGILIALTIINFNSNTPNIKPLNIQDNKNYLIQSKTCKHCKEIKEYMEGKNIEYIKIEVKEVMSLLETLNITTIPVLIKKEESVITIYKSKQSIKDSFENKKDSTNINPFSNIKNENNLFAPDPILDEGCTIKAEEDC